MIREILGGALIVLGIAACYLTVSGGSSFEDIISPLVLLPGLVGLLLIAGGIALLVA